MAKMDNFREDRKTPGASDSSMPATDSVHRWRRWPCGRSGAGQFVVIRRVQEVHSLSCDESEKFAVYRVESPRNSGSKQAGKSRAWSASLRVHVLDFYANKWVTKRYLRCFAVSSKQTLHWNFDWLRGISCRKSILEKCWQGVYLTDLFTIEFTSRIRNWIAYCLLRSAYRPLTSLHELGSLIR